MLNEQQDLMQFEENGAAHEVSDFLKWFYRNLLLFDDLICATNNNEHIFYKFCLKQRNNNFERLVVQRVDTDNDLFDVFNVISVVYNE